MHKRMDSAAARLKSQPCRTRAGYAVHTLTHKAIHKHMHKAPNPARCKLIHSSGDAYGFLMIPFVSSYIQSVRLVLNGKARGALGARLQDQKMKDQTENPESCNYDLRSATYIAKISKRHKLTLQSKMAYRNLLMHSQASAESSSIVNKKSLNVSTSIATLQPAV